MDIYGYLKISNFEENISHKVGGKDILWMNIWWKFQKEIVMGRSHPKNCMRQVNKNNEKWMKSDKVRW